MHFDALHKHPAAPGKGRRLPEPALHGPAATGQAGNGRPASTGQGRATQMKPASDTRGALHDERVGEGARGHGKRAEEQGFSSNDIGTTSKIATLTT